MPSNRWSGKPGGKAGDSERTENDGTNDSPGHVPAGVYMETAPSALLGAVNVKVGQASLESRKTDDTVAQQAPFTIPPGLAMDLPEKPTTLYEARATLKMAAMARSTQA